ncbi:hypothetical protein KAR91_15405 [Candidatus Pacearchaeota archaeon]|nr:hypothetical protein [Candidatus Pacearchaeota archaeon]
MSIETHQTQTSKSATFVVEGRHAVRLYALLSLLFVAGLHVSSAPDSILPYWAQTSILTAICTMTTVGILMFGRADTVSDFSWGTIVVGLWTLAIFASVVFANSVLLYAILIPLLVVIISDCINNRGDISHTFIALLSLWFSTGILLAILSIGLFDDLAMVAQLSSISWYLDIRILLSLILCIVILCRALIVALKSPTRRLIQEIGLWIELPQEGNLLKSIFRGIVDAVNELLLKHLNLFFNIVTGLISVLICYIAATGREISYVIRHHVINVHVFVIVLRRIVLFVSLLCIALAIPSLANGTIKYIRAAGVFDHLIFPIADMSISFFIIFLVQLFYPVNQDIVIQRTGRAVFFLLCVLFTAKTVAIMFSYIPQLDMLYARNFDALYISMLIGILVATIAGLRNRRGSPNNEIETGEN